MSDDDFGLMNDPEASYRRGYQQGAFDAVEALKTMTTDQVRVWVDETLANWRNNQIDNRNLLPPRPWLNRRSRVQPWQPRI
jgi:hypothetical protein